MEVDQEIQVQVEVHPPAHDDQPAPEVQQEPPELPREPEQQVHPAGVMDRVLPIQPVLNQRPAGARPEPQQMEDSDSEPEAPDDWRRRVHRMERNLNELAAHFTEALQSHQRYTENNLKDLQVKLRDAARMQEQRDDRNDRRQQELIQELRYQAQRSREQPVYHVSPREKPAAELTTPTTSRSQPEETRSGDRRPGPSDRSMLGRLDTYDGTTPWLEYQTYFEEYSDFCGWDSVDRARYLCLQLRGGAQSVLIGLEPADRKDYEKVVYALRQHFCPAEKVYTYQAELQARRLQPEESLTDLAREIQCKSRLAYPEAGATILESLMRSHFCNSLTNREMKISVSQGHPRTLNQALALALEYESIVQVDEARTPVSVKKGRNLRADSEQAGSETGDNAMPEPWKEAIDKLTSLIESLKNSPREERRPYERRRPRRDVVCYNCGKPGHYATDCWSRKQPAWQATPRRPNPMADPEPRPREPEPRPAQPATHPVPAATATGAAPSQENTQ